MELQAKQNREAPNAEAVAITALTVVRKHWRVLCVSALFCFFLIFVRKARELFFALEGQRLELSHSQIGIITAVSFAVDGALFPLAGWMLDRVGRVRTGAMSMLGLGCSMLILHGDTFVFYVAFAVVSGLFNGISAGIVQVLSADLSPAECRSQFIGIFGTLVLCTDIAAPTVIGAIAEVTSLKIAGTIMAGASVVGAVFGLSFMRETANFGPRSKEAAKALRPNTKPVQLGKMHKEDAIAMELQGAHIQTKHV